MQRSDFRMLKLLGSGTWRPHSLVRSASSKLSIGLATKPHFRFAREPRKIHSSECKTKALREQADPAKKRRGAESSDHLLSPRLGSLRQKWGLALSTRSAGSRFCRTPISRTYCFLS